MKIFLRILILNLIIGFFIGFTNSFTISNPVSFSDWILTAWIALSILSGFLLLGYLFYNWGTSKFENDKIKTIWFWVLLLGCIVYFIGPLAYYILVYEMRKGIS